MADEIDYANQLADNALSQAINEIRKSVAQNTVGAKNCQECGDVIPKGRQNLGFKLCVPCTEEKERKKQLFAS